MAITLSQIQAAAATAKSAVSESNDWIAACKSLPIEAAALEHAADPDEGDELTEKLRLSWIEAYNNGVSQCEWRDRIFLSMFGPPSTKRRSAVSDLVKVALTLECSFEFRSMAHACRIGDSVADAVLQNCAHLPDLRFRVESRIGMSDWPEQMTFRTAFAAAEYFALQCYHFGNRIAALKLTNVETFNDILEWGRMDRDAANEILLPCICTEDLHAIIDYEAAWLLNLHCGIPEPRRWELSNPQWITDNNAQHVLHYQSKPEIEQTVDQTISVARADGNSEKSKREIKPWTTLATDLKELWFATMRRENSWIPRKLFLHEFLNGKEGKREKWIGIKASTEDRRFQDNPSEWKAESEAVKSSLRTDD